MLTPFSFFSGFVLALVAGLLYAFLFLPVQYLKHCNDGAHSCTGHSYMHRSLKLNSMSLYGQKQIWTTCLESTVASCWPVQYTSSSMPLSSAIGLSFTQTSLSLVSSLAFSGALPCVSISVLTHSQFLNFISCSGVVFGQSVPLPGCGISHSNCCKLITWMIVDCWDESSPPLYTQGPGFVSSAWGILLYREIKVRMTSYT